VARRACWATGGPESHPSALPPDRAIRRLSHYVAGSTADDCTVARTPDIEVRAGGVRAGQCIIQPVANTVTIGDERRRTSLAGTLDRLVRSAAAAFVSNQGASPQFTLGLCFEGRKLCVGSYVPILNHWGFTEYLGLVTGGPVVLPWPHDVTAQHLRSVYLE
jgi:hypothetical protein